MKFECALGWSIPWLYSQGPHKQMNAHSLLLLCKVKFIHTEREIGFHVVQHISPFDHFAARVLLHISISKQRLL
jgi:hypothetical protein